MCLMRSITEDCHLRSSSFAISKSKKCSSSKLAEKSGVKLQLERERYFSSEKQVNLKHQIITIGKPKERVQLEKRPASFSPFAAQGRQNSLQLVPQSRKSLCHVHSSDQCDQFGGCSSTLASTVIRILLPILLFQLIPLVAHHNGLAVNCLPQSPSPSFSLSQAPQFHPISAASSLQARQQTFNNLLFDEKLSSDKTNIAISNQFDRSKSDATTIATNDNNQFGETAIKREYNDDDHNEPAANGASFATSTMTTTTGRQLQSETINSMDPEHFASLAQLNQPSLSAQMHKPHNHRPQQNNNQYRPTLDKNYGEFNHDQQMAFLAEIEPANDDQQSKSTSTANSINRNNNNNNNNNNINNNSGTTLTQINDKIHSFNDNPITRYILTKFLFNEFASRNMTPNSRPFDMLPGTGIPAPDGSVTGSFIPNSPHIKEDILGLGSLPPDPLLINPATALAQNNLSAPIMATTTTSATAATASLASLGATTATGAMVHGHNDSAAAGAAHQNHGAAPRPYFGDALNDFNVLYWPFHIHGCLIICIIGIFANLLNIVVLTRPNMITAVNTILCAIACTDLIVNISNIPYLLHLIMVGDQYVNLVPYHWALYILMHAHVTVTAHTISIWLTCVLATWRYFVVCSPSANQRNWSVSLAIRAIVIVFLLVPVVCIPSYISFTIIEETKTNNTLYTTYLFNERQQRQLASKYISLPWAFLLWPLCCVGFSYLAENSQLIKTFHFWMFSGLTKLLPCVLLTYFTTVLVRKLLSARERRLRLTSGAGNHNFKNRNSYGGANSSIVPCTDTKAAAMVSNGKSKNRLSFINKNHVANGGGPRKGGGDGSSGSNRAVSLSRHDYSTGSNGPMVMTNGIEPAEQHQHQLQEQQSPALVTGDKQDNNNLQQLARKESVRSHQIASKAAESTRQNDASSGGGQEDKVHMDQLDPRLKTRPSAVTPYSGSSCGTDYECLQNGCNNSSDGSTSFSSTDGGNNYDNINYNHHGHNHHHHHNHRQHHHHNQEQRDTANRKLYSDLLVETTNSAAQTSNRNSVAPSNAPGVHIRTTLIPATPKTPLHSPVDQTICSNAEDLEVGAGKIIEGNRDTTDAVPVSSSAREQQQQQQEFQDRQEQEKLFVRSSLAVSVQEFPRETNSIIVGDEFNRAASSLSHSLPKNRNTSADDSARYDRSRNDLSTTRGRSVGSATFAPFQIVKLQATTRQLSQNETTTRLLIAVMILFLICEFPAGILAALCAIFGQEFFENVYQPMGPLTDLFALVNSSVNFILYCLMSTQFRVTFYRVVLRCPAPSAPKPK